MYQQTIVVSSVGVALVIAALLLPRTWTVVVPTQPALVQPSASRDVLKKGMDPSSQSFEDIQSVTQRFADELGRLKEEDQTVSPAKLAEQANAETTYPSRRRPIRPRNSTPRRFTPRRSRASWSSVEFTSATSANIGTSGAPADS